MQKQRTNQKMTGNKTFRIREEQRTIDTAQEKGTENRRESQD